jgi:hypothetical protein
MISVPNPTTKLGRCVRTPTAAVGARGSRLQRVR